MHETTSYPVLGFIVTLFIAIKGFAAARNEQERLTAVSSRKQMDKKSKSFRGKLKKCWAQNIIPILQLLKLTTVWFIHF